MNKFYGSVGYGLSEAVETSPGVWEYNITERNYYGDILNNNFKQQNTGNVNDDIIISNKISIVADPYAIQHFHEIKYVTWMQQKWKVVSVEVNAPRLILSLGGIYVDQE